MIGGIVSLIVGYFADTVNRTILFSVLVFIGELSCLLTFWTRTYAQLFVCRIFTGISIGGSVPCIFSLLGDLYPVSQRIYVSTWFFTLSQLYYTNNSYYKIG